MQLNESFLSAPVIVVNSDPESLINCQYLLETNGIPHTLPCPDSLTALRLISEHGDIGAVLLDLDMPGKNGEEILGVIHERWPDLPVILITGWNEIECALRGIKAGAFDCLLKPLDETRLLSAVRRALELREVRFEYTAFRDRVLHNRLEQPRAFAEIITRNARMHSIFQYSETIAATPRPVLITGETGVGKELLALAVHAVSGRTGKFVAVNVAGLDDNLFSDTLFGHLKGAFTGADRARAGLVEQAARGTLFLDEIGDLEPASQIKLLRLLQEQEFFPLGADTARPVEARIIVATNRDLQPLLQEKKFRTDLYYRLQTHHIHIPPLRERIEDIPILTDHFLEQAARTLKKKKPTVPKELFPLLASYSFPGNVRELEGLVFDAMSRHKSRMLSTEVFRTHIEKHRGKDLHRPALAASPQLAEPNKGTPPSLFSGLERLPTLQELPELLIAEAMRRANGNQSLAAQWLGISRSGLCKALKRSGTPPPK